MYYRRLRVKARLLIPVIDSPMHLSVTQLILLTLAWTLYGAIHSILASTALKRHVAQRWPQWQRAYRLMFNATAVLLLIPLLGLTWAWRGPLLWAWTGPWEWAANAIALAALATFAWSTRHYDMRTFSGTAQWNGRGDATDDNERLHISPLHRYVRHPWYFLALLILWTRDMDEARLVSTACITAYFWLGSLLEERKLIAHHGEAYARYRQRVGGLIPLPGHTLNEQEARKLVEMARRDR
jgi:protein-S-isoprenylcysteine O-methyltransferase Ste14